MHSKKISPSQRRASSKTAGLIHSYFRSSSGQASPQKKQPPAVNGLLADVIHQVRTPMNDILGMLELLLDSPLTEKQQESARIAQAGAEDLLALFNNTLDLPLMEVGALPLRRTSFDLHQVMESIFEAAAARARLRGIVLDIRCNALTQCPTVIGDVERLQQALSNLIAYATRFSANELIVVEGTQNATPQGNCALQLRVETKSPLLAKKLAAHAANEHDGREPEGANKFDATELGLVVCHHLMELMGGWLEIDCLPDERVLISLDLEFEQAPDPLDGIRVLLADSNPERQAALSAALAAQRLRIDSVDTAADTLAALAATSSDGDIYRIAILDQNLRGVDGETFGSAIRADRMHADTLLILLGQVETAKLEKAGFSAMVSKPADISCLLETMKTLCLGACEGRPLPFIVDGVSVVTSGQTRAHANRRVLVVDDDPISRRVASHMLEEIGCIADIACDGKRAAAMHAEKAYDLILMDCEMPGMDGYQTTLEIRGSECHGKRTPIIAWTARVTAEESRKSLAGGFDDFMPKPIRRQVLLDLLDTWLAATDMQEDNATPLQQDELDEVQEMFGDGFAELVALFRKDSPNRIVGLHTAAAENDAMKIAKIAHAFSGSSASLGASTLSSLCKQLELNAREGTMCDLANRLDEIEREYAKVDARLRTMLAGSDE